MATIFRVAKIEAQGIASVFRVAQVNLTQPAETAVKFRVAQVGLTQTAVKFLVAKVDAVASVSTTRFRVSAAALVAAQFDMYAYDGTDIRPISVYTYDGSNIIHPYL